MVNKKKSYCIFTVLSEYLLPDYYYYLYNMCIEKSVAQSDEPRHTVPLPFPLALWSLLASFSSLLLQLYTTLRPQLHLPLEVGLNL